MSNIEIAELNFSANPIDVIEQVVSSEEWPFDRSGEDELSISITGAWCDYHITFNWRQDLEALHMGCAFDLRVSTDKRAQIYALLAMINEQMWVGHFDLWSEEGVVLFRHGLMMNGGASPTSQQVEALLHLSMEACERYFPAFQFVLWAGKSAGEAMASCAFDAQGTA
jgi:hypothetical protein